MKIFISFLFLALSTCGSLPSSGPKPRDVENATTPAPYQVIEMDEVTLRLLSETKPPSLLGHFGNATPIPPQRLGIGDTLSIAIYESASGGLFSAPLGVASLNGAKNVVLPNQSIDRDGKITVPYAGRVQANGLTPASLSKTIESLLKERAIEPQVVVTLISNASMTATVLGDVTTSGKIPLNMRGERVLDVLASAGLKTPEHGVLIRLVRGAKMHTIALSTLITKPSENIFVRPNDILYILKEEQPFYAFGAVGKQGQFIIDQAGLRLSDALGKAGGLVDTQANNLAVYLFRYENERVTKQLFNAQRIKEPQNNLPLIYKFDFSKPQALFYMTQIPLQPRDVLYVSTALSVEWGKFLSLIGTGLGTMRASSSIAAQIQ
jgi:polysaccharide biosynthesis/export protein